MRESDIIHESGNYWVSRQISRNDRIAPINSIYFEVFKTGATHSTSTGYFTANLARAIAVCDRMASNEN